MGVVSLTSCTSEDCISLLVRTLPDKPMTEPIMK